MKNMCSIALVCSVFSWSAAIAQEDVELSVEEKVQAAYEAYSANDQVTLNRGPWRANLVFGMEHRNVSLLGLGNVEQTLWTSELTLGYGLTEAMELSVTIPYGFTQQELNQFGGELLSESDSGLGRLQFGVAHAIPNSFGSLAAFGRVALDTGTGAFADRGTETTIGLNASKVMRPAFVYGGINWGRNWETDLNSLGWTAGLGFSLNEQLSVGSEVVGSYLLDDPIGTSRQSHQINVRATWLITEDLALSPAVSLGASGDAPDFGARVGIEVRF